VEVTLTFLSDDPGNFVREVVPTPGDVTLREHHSFVELPGPGFQPRAFDPRSGFFGIEFMDFATPIDQPIRKRYIARHRVFGAANVSATLQEQADRLESELRDRHAIGKAKEILQDVLDLSEEEAYIQLRNASRQSRRRLPDVAKDVPRQTAVGFADLNDEFARDPGGQM
jgi:hypothetical protein